MADERGFSRRCLPAEEFHASREFLSFVRCRETRFPPRARALESSDFRTTSQLRKNGPVAFLASRRSILRRLRVYALRRDAGRDAMRTRRGSGDASVVLQRDDSRSTRGRIALSTRRDGIKISHGNQRIRRFVQITASSGSKYQHFQLVLNSFARSHFVGRILSTSWLFLCLTNTVDTKI